MRPLSYARATDVGDRDRDGPRRPGRRVPRRRHDGGRPAADRRGAPRQGGRHQRPAVPRRRGPPGRRAAARRAGPDERRGARPAGRRALPGRRAVAAARRVGAAAQHGLHGRQPVPAGALRATSATASRPATSAIRARGCAALDGLNRGHAVLGTSEHCIATHPSDVAVALVALDAVVHIDRARRGARTIPIDDFFLLPGDTPHVEHPLEHGELDRRDRPAGGAGRAPLAVPQGPRPRVVRVRARLGRRGAARRRTVWSPSVRLALGGVGHQAVAGAPGGGAPRRRAGDRRSRSRTRPRAELARPRRTGTTRSRSSSRGARSSGR